MESDFAQFLFVLPHFLTANRFPPRLKMLYADFANRREAANQQSWSLAKMKDAIRPGTRRVAPERITTVEKSRASPVLIKSGFALLLLSERIF
jgi:hypothetical protein